ncbi:hypothetical protein E2I00_016793 [Balaenoptera physalus]|uniref:C2H2-type domain-containing protein n=1 Tax=Balaenoptera physalus TaxID=9770 RepID=A0A6A1QAC0_BALPH|nr:hypothetical protein E2I00_016793 [Balaenoptera physalus]
MGLSTCSAEMTDPFCVGGGRRLPASSKSGPGKDGGRNEVRLPMLHDPPKLGLPVVRGGQTAPSQAPLCFDRGSPASDRTEGKKKGRPKAENQALRDIPVSSPRAGWGSCRVCGGAHCLARPACCVSSAEPSARIHWLLRVRGLQETAWGPVGPVRGSCRPGDSAELGAGQQRPGWLQGQQPGLSHAQLSLMNQWKDEFKAHSRVKCPNAGCWLEFPSIYGLKYHYQRCQGGAISERLTFPCPFCEAAFTSKTQLEKHRIWNHMDRPLPAPKPGPVSRPVTVSRPVGVSKPIGPVTVSRPVPVTKPVTASRPVPVTKAVPVTRPVPVNKPIPVTKSVPIAKPVTVNKPVPVTKPVTINKPVSVTKLVTVTKPVPVAKPVTVSRPIVVSKPVTVSRPIAISRHVPPCKMVLLTKSENKAPRAAGRSSGLAKAEDKARIHRAKKQEGPVPEEARKKGPAPTSAEQWQRAIHERGEAVCPTCSVVTRKTLVGLKKHMEVCQKVRLPPVPGRGGGPGPAAHKRARLQLQDALKCQHCRKQFKSKAGLNYHTMAEHSAKGPTCIMGRGDGRIRRTSAQVAVFHLQEIAEDELARDWTKRRMKDDLVPETARLNYTRPGLPVLNPQLLEEWKNEVKEKGHVNCPNDCCEAVYSSVSGLKAHLAGCSKGDHLVGKYCCLLCPKEFSSESGVKYHILKAHAEVRQGRAWCESPAGPAAGCAGPMEGAGKGRGVRGPGAQGSHRCFPPPELVPHFGRPASQTQGPRLPGAQEGEESGWREEAGPQAQGATP